MDYLDIEYKENSVVLKDTKNFDVKQIFESGQCFRWEKQSEYRYIGIAFGKVLDVEQIGKDIILHNTNEQDFKNIWFDYFDLSTDYSKIKAELSDDELLGQAVKYGDGIRILNQEAFEMVISFIISARNSIPVISKTIKGMSERWGNKLIYNGKDFYAFPTKDVLAKVTEAEMKEAGGSFRSRYIIDTSSKINDTVLINEGKLTIENQEEFLEKYDLYKIITLDDELCHKALQNYNGVGAKVADCIMLFSMGKKSAFPVDIWVKRAMMHFYGASDLSLPKIRVFGRERFGGLSGIAQQYLFYYARENGIKL